MKTRFFVSLSLLLPLGLGAAPAQMLTNAPAHRPAVLDVPQPVQPSAAGTTDPAKIAEFQQRFQDGYALEQQGKLAEARAIYDGILAEEPHARRSLLEAGKISLKLNELDKANDYLERLHEIEPDFPPAIELLIQINQGLKRDVKVLRLIREFRDLHDSGKAPDFTKSPYFVRERVPLDADRTMIFTEFFDYKQAPNTVWMGEVFDSTGEVTRRLLLNYDPGAAPELQKNDAAKAGQFLLVEDVIVGGEVRRVDAYFQMFSLPEYNKVRNTMLAVIGGVYKPVFSQNVGSASH